MKYLLSILMSGIALLAGAAESGFALVENGTAQTAIVLPARAKKVEKYAAEELQKHIALITGCELSIVRENKPEGNFRNLIYLGDTEATRKLGIDVTTQPNNSTFQKITDNAIYLFGLDGGGAPPMEDNTPMGTLFAVYDFLNQQFGVRWLWPGEAGIYAPKSPTVYSGAPREIIKTQKLLHTRLRDNSGLGNYKKVLSEEDYRRALFERQQWMRRHQFARGTSFEYGHGFEKYWSRFNESHPEFFAMRSNGERTPFDMKRVDLVQMCVSNEGFRKQVIEDWMTGKQSYKGPFINSAENDKVVGDEWCFCENCRAWDPPSMRMTAEQYLKIKAADPVPNILSDRYSRFMLELQKEAAKHKENPIVLGYAYSGYSKPPVEAKLNENIIVAIVPREYYPLEPEARRIMLNQWDGWRKTGARLYLRPNYLLAGYTFPFIFARQFGEDYKYCYENGMVGTDFDSLTGQFGVQGPNLYMVARLTDKPEMSVDEVLAEYYDSFGAASPHVREYFEMWEALTSKCDQAFGRKNNKGGWNKMGFHGHQIYSMADVAKGEQIMAKAREAVKDNPADAARVEFLLKGLKHTRMTLETMLAYHEWHTNYNQANKDAFENSFKALEEYRQTIRHDHVVNLVLLEKLETWMSWRR